VTGEYHSAFDTLADSLMPRHVRQELAGDLQGQNRIEAARDVDGRQQIGHVPPPSRCIDEACAAVIAPGHSSHLSIRAVAVDS
jgi:hypothetical protein